MAVPLDTTWIYNECAVPYFPDYKSTFFYIEKSFEKVGVDLYSGFDLYCRSLFCNDTLILTS